MRRPLLLWSLSVLLVGSGPCASRSAPPAPMVAAPSEVLTVAVVDRFPHDTNAFTQGLLWHQGKLYESTGRVGLSTLRRVDLATGRVEQSVDIAPPVFAEGLARVGDQLVQLSWREQKAFVWRLDDFRALAQHSYDGEGWGLTYDGRRLIMSDGTTRLFFRDPTSFAVTGSIEVTRDKVPLTYLNELEWADGHVYANVWQTNSIVRIDPATGAVTATIDASGLLSAEERIGVDYLNGIAHVPERGTFLITGKLWPRLFEVRFVRK